MKTKSNRERFEEVASKRVKRVLDSMDSLSKCSNKSNYEYNDSDVKKMMTAIREKVKNLEFLFTQNSESNNDFNF